MRNFNHKKIAHFALLGILLTGVITGALFLADFITESESAQRTVASMGYTGVLIIAIISGLNSIAPVPPAAFVPLFTAAGLYLPIVITMLIIGTTIADFMGYVFGKWSKEFVIEHYPKMYARTAKLIVKDTKMLFWFVLTYAAVIPFPNEAFIIPLAILGVPLYRFLFPLVLGTAIYHTGTAYGMQELFYSFF